MFSSLSHRLVTNKLFLGVIIIMELAILGAVIYLKFFSRWANVIIWERSTLWISYEPRLSASVSSSNNTFHPAVPVSEHSLWEDSLYGQVMIFWRYFWTSYKLSELLFTLHCSISKVNPCRIILWTATHPRDYYLYMISDSWLLLVLWVNILVLVLVKC